MADLQKKMTKEENSCDADFLQKRAVPWIGVRHLQCLLLFVCEATFYLHKVNLSMTIVAMDPIVNSTDYYREQENHVPIFSWSTKTKSVMLSAFFVGYMLANFPASVLGCRFNNKRMLALSMAVSSLLAFICPFATVWFGAPAIIFIRFVQGLFCACMVPMITNIMTRWVPPQERSRLVGWVINGTHLGTMGTLAVAGSLASSKMGWPLVYYLTGTLGLTWTAVWLCIGSDNLSSHRFIGQAEKDYIQSSLSNTVGHDLRLSNTPWKAIFTSVPVWATTIAHIGNSWGFWLLLTEMPTYINSVLKFDIKEDGALSSLPYCAMFLLQMPVSYAADVLNQRKVITLTVSRKMWNTISTWGGTAGLIALGYLQNNTTLTIGLYVFIVAIGCSTNAGANINHFDLAPNYAGIVIGIANTAAAAAGICAPLFVGLMIDDPTSISQWRTVFLSGAIVLFSANLFYIIFGTAETQSWNSLEEDTPIVDNTNTKLEFEIPELTVETSPEHI